MTVSSGKKAGNKNTREFLPPQPAGDKIHVNFWALPNVVNLRKMRYE
jgi:hypothetical protein